MMFQVVSAVLSVYFFTMLLEIPKRYALYCSIVGGVNWWVYLLAIENSASSMAAAFFCLSGSSDPKSDLCTHTEDTG